MSRPAPKSARPRRDRRSGSTLCPCGNSIARRRLRRKIRTGMYTRLFALRLSPGRPPGAPARPSRSRPTLMARLVMKFGGTSVADIDRIRNVARHVKREVSAGHEVAVVVSAMAGTTNRLVDWCREASPLHDAREYDAVVASGEQVTAGLLAIALQAAGINARSSQR